MQNHPLNLYSVSSLNQFIETTITKSILNCFPAHSNLIEVVGFLDDFKPGDYPTVYGVQLIDGDARVPMNILKSLLDKFDLKGGEYVRVVGVILPKQEKFKKNTVTPTFVVSHIEPIDSPKALEDKRKDQASLKALKSLNPVRHAFPFRSKIKITILRSRQSHVIEDFTGQLKDLENITFDEIGVSMTDAGELTAAIKKCDGDVIAIIRGGGDPDGFDCFNSIALLTAINEHKAYRVLGIGHSLDVTLADCVCDYSASTPTAAGLHIKEMITEYANLITGEKQALETQKLALTQQNKLLLNTAENLRAETAALQQKNHSQTIQINAMSLEKNTHFSKFDQRLEADTAELRQKNRTQAIWLKRLVGISLVFALYFVFSMVRK